MKIYRKIISLAMALTIAATLSAHVFADTYYVIDGYRYKLSNNDQVILSGSEDSANPNLVVPGKVGIRDVSVVGLFAFSSDENITSVSFEEADNLVTISAYAFSNCRNLSTVKLNSSIQNIGIGAFAGCWSLSEIDLETTKVKTINNSAFANCSSLEEVVIPKTATKIDVFAFENCTSLSKITLGSQVTEIADTAFDNDTSLTIYCYPNTRAHLYAVEKNIPYVLLDGIKLGDVDKNSYVDIRDVTEIQKHLAELGEPLDELALYAADVNGDGEVDITDATAIQLFLAELDFTYPIGEYIS
ncbi:MAG: leucine-rich repeat protein [Ruminococcus sp.]|nr:leucine-rich repeat protein [Ruminococcus sp.]